jgi:HipA-like protein
MMRKIKNLFGKDEEEFKVTADSGDEEFSLYLGNIKVGILSYKEGKWYFHYTEEFKQHSDKYYRIIGFPDLGKTYESEELWPFFRIRIPGLKQPAIRETLEKEDIDPKNEVELLKRFGLTTPSNPYELKPE